MNNHLYRLRGDAKMTPKEINRLVGYELKHIPNWPELQNMLRFVYAALRKISLGKKARGVKSREDVLRESIPIVKKTNPNWMEQFPPGFFKV
jgi:hypothetical protein